VTILLGLVLAAVVVALFILFRFVEELFEGM